jgi:molybdate transport system substrate-binding protein
MQTLHVVSSGGFAKAYEFLAPSFEKQTGIKLVSSWGPSMGVTYNAIPNRLKRLDEAIDVVIMGEKWLDELVSEGKLASHSKVRLALSPIACAVKKNTSIPDISTVASFRETLLQAKSIAYSDSVSGEYFKNELLSLLCVVQEDCSREKILGKSKRIQATPVGEYVARGEAELGIQQLSELKYIDGIDIVGLLPDEIQLKTPFSAAIVTTSTRMNEATKLIEFLSAPANAYIIKEAGLEPCVPACD